MKDFDGLDKNYFEILNSINVSDKTEKKNGLTYLSWAWAWGELKKKFPLSYYTVYENKDGWNYFTDGMTCWVKTGVTVSDVSNVDKVGVEHIEYLPVMDFKNKSIPAANITSFDVNKAIQRSLTKAVARHGLGLYIYAGEDLPESGTPDKQADIPEAEKVDVNRKINSTEVAAIKGLAERVNADVPKMLEVYKVKSLDDLTLGQWNEAQAFLNRKKK